MPEPVPLRRGVPGRETPAAIYLIGHGPLREPRFIELQHMRIRRFMRLLNEFEGRHFRIVSTLVDLNFPRVSVADADPLSRLPGLSQLLELIRSRSIEVLFLDYACADQSSDYFQPHRIDRLDVEILNACYEGDKLLARVISMGPEVPRDLVTPPREAEDLTTYFPAAVARVVDYLTLFWNPTPETLEQLERRVSALRDDQPYRFGGEPTWSQRRELGP